jgi:hypothetical protein
MGINLDEIVGFLATIFYFAIDSLPSQRGVEGSNPFISTKDFKKYQDVELGGSVLIFFLPRLPFSCSPTAN